ncbi:MAG: L-serine ammonia-lyase, iron-sulfur-dependent, subunit alpha, partial [Clostridia bacterium]|nr:L-serine ammonia-lyase, iron-sulfur-dependent, subunit alpha [Clostridia bacterium]
ALNAWAAAEMALAGIESVIPVDEVIGAMKEIGEEMPTKLKETSMGGLATTPTGKKIAREQRTGRE